MQQVQIRLHGLPIVLVLLSNGGLVFVPTAAFSAIIENDQELGAQFFPDEFFFIDGKTGAVEELSYNVIYDFKLYPLMLRWLQQQKLQSPFE